MKNNINNINEFINKSVAYIRKSFNEKFGNQYDFLDVYPYMDIDCEQFDDSFDICIQSTYDYVGQLYETMLPLDVKKDYGQFYTRNSDIIDIMLDELDLLQGKILEPSCDSGVFKTKIVRILSVALRGT